MQQKYKDWVNNYPGETFRKCQEVTEEMKKVFPELRIAKGLVTIIENGRDYQHQWLVDENDLIVDPTSNQWAGIMQYKEIKEGDPYPTGVCANCGGFIFSDYGDSTVCSDKCHKEYMRYINTGVL